VRHITPLNADRPYDEPADRKGETRGDASGIPDADHRLAHVRAEGEPLEPIRQIKAGTDEVH
jgi:hypothetical protein